MSANVSCSRSGVIGLAVAVLMAALPASAHTPTITFGPSPTPTPTGTLPPPQAAITARPNPARPAQRVVLDGSASLRAGGRYPWSQVGGQPAVQIATADQAVASFIVPPLSAPAEITIELSLGRAARLLPAGSVAHPARRLRAAAERRAARQPGGPRGRRRVPRGRLGERVPQLRGPLPR